MYLIVIGIMMILFGDMSNDNIGALIILAGVFLKFVEKVYDKWQSNKAAAGVAKEVSAKAFEIKKVIVASESTKTDHLNAQDRRLAQIAAQVQDVHGSVEVVKTQTNGLVEKVEKAAYDKGVSDAKCQDVTEQTALPGANRPVGSQNNPGSDSAISKKIT